ncbi:hypothetical protein MSPP1_001566 [Malassezia sp. CBS 17886]|nr:hypothetical protein MSPP1_001566 [Malassezia sp. CBS 17886]
MPLHTRGPSQKPTLGNITSDADVYATDAQRLAVMDRGISSPRAASAIQLGSSAQLASEPLARVGTMSEPHKPGYTESVLSRSSAGLATTTTATTASSSRSLFSKLANRLARSGPEAAETAEVAASCGFLKRSTGPLSLAWWSDALPTARNANRREPGRGWRPFKAVLRGDKLYFYRVPGAMVPEVRNTFLVRSTMWPTPYAGEEEECASDVEAGAAEDARGDEGIRAADLDELDVGSMTLDDGLSTAADDESRSEAGGADAPITWDSPTKHPELVLVRTGMLPVRWAERIDSGTPHALAHEVVFGTQRVVEQASMSLDTPADIVRVQDNDEKTFLHMVFYSLGNSSASWDVFMHALRDQLCVAVRLKLAQSELGCTRRVLLFLDLLLWKRPLLAHGREVLFFDQVEALVVELARLEPETYVHYVRQIRAWRDQCALGGGSQPTNWIESVSLPTTRVARRAELNDLHTCWSVSLFLRSDASEIAGQIQVFHADRFQAFLQVPVTAYRLSSIVAEGLLRSLRFDSIRPHWLTHVILRQLLVDEAPERQGVPAEEQLQNRVKVLEQWIAVAMFLLQLRDLAGWVAVCSAICSRAVANMEQLWRGVAVDRRRVVVSEWTPRLAALGWVEGVHTEVAALFSYADGMPHADVAQPATIPFFGNAGLQNAANAKHPLQRQETKRRRITIQLAAQEPEFNRVRALAQRLTAAYPNTGERLPTGHTPVAEYQCLFQRLAQHEYPLHTGTTDYMGSSILADSGAADRGPLTALRMWPTAALPAALAVFTFPQAFPTLAFPHPSDGTHVGAREVALASDQSDPLPFSGTATWVARSEPTSDDVAIGSELVLRPVYHRPQTPPPPPPPTTLTLGGDAGAAGHMAVPRPPLGLARRVSQDLSRAPSCTAAAAAAPELDGLQYMLARPATNTVGGMDLFPVEVRAVTLTRLVDILVLGTKHLVVRAPLDTRGGDMQEFRVLRVSMDLDAFREAFLLSYSTTTSAGALFEALRVRWCAAEAASREMAMYARTHVPNQFPSWNTSAGVPYMKEPVNWDIFTKIRVGILDALKLWLELYTREWIRDLVLFEALYVFLKQAEQESAAMASDVPGISNAIASLLAMYPRLAYNAVGVCGMDTSTPGDIFETLATEIPVPHAFDWASQSAADLVEYFDTVTVPAFAAVTKHDLAFVLRGAELMHANPGSWVAAASSTLTKPDALSILHMMRETPALQMFTRAKDGDTLHSVLRPSLQELGTISIIITTWTRAQVTEPRIGLDRRCARIATLLDAVLLCRARMACAARRQRPDSDGIREPLPASLVEAAVTAGLTCADSQHHRAAWEQTAVKRRADVWTDLLSGPSTTMPLPSGNAVPDVGWMLSYLAQSIVRAPKGRRGDVAMLEFGKYLTARDVICDILRFQTPTRPDTHSMVIARARLFWLREVGTKAAWSTQTVIEDAALESTFKSTPSVAPPALFAPVNAARQQKLAELVQLQKSVGALAVPSIAAGSLPPLPNAAQEAMPDMSPAEAVDFSPLPGDADAMHAMVQSADALGAATTGAAALLAAVPMGRPASVFNCAGALLSVWPYQKHPFVFQLAAPNGTKCTLKVPNYDEFCHWLAQLQGLPVVRMAESFDAGTYAAHVAEYLGRASAASVFRVPLAELAVRDGSPIPPVIECLLQEIELRGLAEQGLYRVSGSKNVVDALQQALDSKPAGAIALRKTDIHAVASVVKLWLRELPEPLVPFAFYHRLLETEQLANHSQRVRAMRKLIAAFPKSHFRALRRVAAHLALVAQASKKNLMAPHNIGLVFGSTILNPPPGPGSVAEGFNNLGRSAHIVKIMVVMYRHIFRDAAAP